MKMYPRTWTQIATGFAVAALILLLVVPWLNASLPTWESVAWNGGTLALAALVCAMASDFS